MFINRIAVQYSMDKNPKSIAIILDGNRRYGKKKGLMPWQGHQFGTKKVEEFIDWCHELGIKELTLYSFSSENFNRDKKEVNFLMSLFRKQIKRLKNDDELKKDKLEKYKLRISFIGRLNLFPEDLQNEMREVMEMTKNNTGLKVNFAMGYGGRAEIVDAAKKIAKKIKNNELKIEELDEEAFSENLYLKNEPDILIRPGGEIRISNFLLWQAAYSELFFIDKLWPEFTKEDLIKCIEEFKSRERRFGR